MGVIRTSWARWLAPILVVVLGVAASPVVAQVGAGAPAAPKPVIGVVDLQRIMAQSSAAKAVAAKREQYVTAYQTQVAEQEKKLRTADEDLARQRSVLDAEVFAEKRDAFQKQVADFQRVVQARRRNLEKAYGQAMNEIQGTVIRVTDQVASERGMNLIVYRTQVFLFDPKMDITDEVLARVNKQLPSVTMADPDTMSSSDARGGQ